MEKFSTGCDHYLNSSSGKGNFYEQLLSNFVFTLECRNEPSLEMSKVKSVKVSSFLKDLQLLSNLPAV